MNAYSQRFPWHVAPQEGFEPPDLLSLRFSGPPPSTSRPLRHLGTNGRHRTGDLLLATLLPAHGRNLYLSLPFSLAVFLMPKKNSRSIKGGLYKDSFRIDTELFRFLLWLLQYKNFATKKHPPQHMLGGCFCYAIEVKY